MQDTKMIMIIITIVNGNKFSGSTEYFSDPPIDLTLIEQFFPVYCVSDKNDVLF